MLAAILNMAVKTNFHGEAAGCLSAARIAYKVCVVGGGGGAGRGGRVLRISSDRDDRMGAKKSLRLPIKSKKSLDQ